MDGGAGGSIQAPRDGVSRVRFRRYFTGVARLSRKHVTPATPPPGSSAPQATGLGHAARESRRAGRCLGQSCSASRNVRPRRPERRLSCKKVLVATVHLICGSTGAGKTTYAKALATRTHAVRLSIEDWMAMLFW